MQHYLIKMLHLVFERAMINGASLWFNYRFFERFCRRTFR
jgi:hypothetical protein